MKLSNVEKDSLESVAHAIIDGLTPNADGATILHLSGEMGAGKTTFTKSLAKALGVKETVHSPTFILMNEYDTQHRYFKRLVHIDGYRFDDKNESRVLSLDEYTLDPHSLIVIEWPDRVHSPSPTATIHIDVDSEHTRTFRLR